MLTTENWQLRQPGTYVLWFDVPTALRFPSLRLSRAEVGPGRYVYVGSALGPGGLAARLGRHLQAPPAQTGRRPHWHVDYLAALCRPSLAGFAVSADRRECRWVQLLHDSGAGWAIAGFGSSDCRAGCRAHLLSVPVLWTIDTVKELLV